MKSTLNAAFLWCGFGVSFPVLKRIFVTTLKRKKTSLDPHG